MTSPMPTIGLKSTFERGGGDTVLKVKGFDGMTPERWAYYAT